MAIVGWWRQPAVMRHPWRATAMTRTARHHGRAARAPGYEAVHRVSVADTMAIVSWWRQPAVMRHRWRATVMTCLGLGIIAVLLGFIDADWGGILIGALITIG